MDETVPVFVFFSFKKNTQPIFGCCRLCEKRDVYAYFNRKHEVLAKGRFRIINDDLKRPKSVYFVFYGEATRLLKYERSVQDILNTLNIKERVDYTNLYVMKKNDEGEYEIKSMVANLRWSFYRHVVDRVFSYFQNLLGCFSYCGVTIGRFYFFMRMANWTDQSYLPTLPTMT